MLLRHICVYLDPDELDWGQSDFLFRSYYVSDYLTRRIRALRWKTSYLKGLFVQARRADAPAPSLSSEGHLLVPLIFDEQGYNALQRARTPRIP